MNSKFKLITAIFLLSIIGCGDSSNPVSECNETEWGEQVSAELNAIAEAATEYAQEQTLQNCEAYKDAYRNYLEALKAVDSACIPTASAQDYQNSIAEAEQALAQINCGEEV